MKPQLDDRVKRMSLEGDFGDAFNGLGVVRLSTGGFQVMFSDGMGWDHVSVSRPDRAPTWDEMCQIKDIFFLPEEAVVQYHPPRSEYVNIHPNCLHLWRPHDVALPLPPTMMV